MSRNLCKTCCHFCSEAVELDEEPRLVTEAETGRNYYPAYRSMLVANATCTVCEAQYLAWIDYPAPHSRGPGDLPFVDLSFRSTFNDEPGAADAPRWLVERVVTFNKTPWPRCPKCEAPRRAAYTTRCFECGDGR